MFKPQIFVNKDEVLQLATEEQIFAMYGLPVTNKMFCNPFRNDKNPTCSLYRNANGVLNFNDFGSDWHTDCFGLVSKLYNISYYAAVQKVYKDLMKGRKPNGKMMAVDSIGRKEKVVIEIKKRRFNEHDLDYWRSYGITLASCNKYDTYAAEWVRVNGNVVYTYSKYSPSYAYWLGKDAESGIDEFKVYFPKRKKYRFLSNSSTIQGWRQLDWDADHLIIQKSMKDVMLMSEYGLNSIAFSGELAKPSEETLALLKESFRHIFVWYDNDDAGSRGLSHFDGFIPLQLEGKYKDATDHYKKYGTIKDTEPFRKIRELVQ